MSFGKRGKALGNRKSQKLFSKGGMNIKRKNYAPKPMRGGIRL